MPKLNNSYTLLRDPDAVRDHFRGCGDIAFDIETSGLSPFQDRVAVITLCDKDNTVGLLHCRGEIPYFMKDLLEQEGRTVIGHNVVGFDAIFMAATNGCGLDLAKPDWYDTMVAEHALLPMGRRLSARLADTLERRFTSKKARKMELPGGHSWMFGEIDDTQLDYVVNDVLWLLPLREKQKEHAYTLDPSGKLWQGINFEMSVLAASMFMKLNGLPIRWEKVQEFVAECEAKKEELLPKITAELGYTPNFRSPKQLKEALWSIGLEVPNTSADTLKDLDLTTHHPVARLILDYKKADTTTKMYTDDWKQEHIEIDGKVHASFRQLGTETGRFSCIKPNLQQQDRRYRSMFQVQSDDEVIISADYSGLEIRIAAAVAGDQTMVEALKAADLHSAVAAQLFGKDQDKVTPEERFLAKRCVFTLLFGGGSNRLYNDARLLGSSITPVEAAETVDIFFETYQGLRAERQLAYNISKRTQAWTYTSPSGLRRTLVKGLGTLIPPTILNTKVQSAAAVGLKLALSQCLTRGLGPYLSAVVHDEIVMVVPKAEALEKMDLLADCMLDGMSKITTVPLSVEANASRTWDKKGQWRYTLIDGVKSKEKMNHDS